MRRRTPRSRTPRKRAHLQFLDSGGGDGVQLARSALGEFDPSLLRVAAGSGALSVRRSVQLDAETSVWIGTSSGAHPGAAVEVTGPAQQQQPAAVGPAWQAVLRLITATEPGLVELVRELAARDVPVPEVGYELGDAAWQAELAWPAARIGVVTAAGPGDPEGSGRDAAYAAAGWLVRTVSEWQASDLASNLTLNLVANLATNLATNPASRIDGPLGSRRDSQSCGTAADPHPGQARPGQARAGAGSRRHRRGGSRAARRTSNGRCSRPSPTRTWSTSVWFRPCFR
ncbi:hypothetical protein CcI156_12195 [Frankia sp. CcI156]|uniref:hypothetical protein n=1 Tax=unclassified Frankia TaxID=2632575 RepID=UPI0003F8A5CE|nr:MULTISPECIES: hypothetical protein [unclassified Frankia]OHV52316.1 hypothetical protein CgIS1_03085 [Frankia sp. CgIS1]ONH25931.1 hypothetical protein CcI156_12195 [Frankia sp. CcI156]ORT47173.1 hypothetical protein KBI5_21190 [Frankia sp. KB5]